MTRKARDLYQYPAQYGAKFDHREKPLGGDPTAAARKDDDPEHVALRKFEAKEAEKEEKRKAEAKEKRKAKPRDRAAEKARREAKRANREHAEALHRLWKEAGDERARDKKIDEINERTRAVLALRDLDKAVAKLDGVDHGDRKWIAAEALRRVLGGNIKSIDIPRAIREAVEARKWNVLLQNCNEQLARYCERNKISEK